MKNAVTIFLLLIVSIAANAQILDGNWKGKMSGSDGDMDLIFSFKVTGDTLSGNVTSEMGTLPLENGKVDGNHFSFDVNVNGQLINHTGSLDSGIVKLSVPWTAEPIELRRVKGESKINGTWAGMVDGPQGETELTFTFNVDGNNLTGADSSSMGVINLTNGIVNGNEFSFDIDLQGMKISHKCEYLTDDTIDVTADVMDQKINLKLTRAVK